MRNITLVLGLLLSTYSCTKMEMEKPGNLVPETVDLDSDLPAITINGTKLHAETFGDIHNPIIIFIPGGPCLLYTSDAADDMQCVDLGGRRIIKKKLVMSCLT